MVQPKTISRTRTYMFLREIYKARHAVYTNPAERGNRLRIYDMRYFARSRRQ